MFSKLFGSKKEKITEAYDGSPLVNDFSFLGADMHSHYIPGIDDGAQTVDDSIALIERMRDMGYTRVVTTPHIKVDHYPNNPETINGGLAILKEAMAERGINFPVHAAAEYFIDDHFSQLIDKEPLLTVREKEVLVEISFMFEPYNLSETLFRLQTAGYKPIMAHPERYMYYHHDLDKYRELKDRGCYLQMNVNALTGYYGKPVKAIAEKLLDEGLYDYCGSDMHHIKHADVLESIKNRPEILHKLQTHPFRNRMIEL